MDVQCLGSSCELGAMLQTPIIFPRYRKWKNQWSRKVTRKEQPESLFRWQRDTGFNPLPQKTLQQAMPTAQPRETARFQCGYHTITHIQVVQEAISQSDTIYPSLQVTKKHLILSTPQRY
ncbi:hypothetical protein FKM82_007683 [Ascaphus truei]